MLIKHSNISNIIRFTLKNSSTGIGLTGLTNASAGLIIATICNNEASTTVYTQAASNIETIAALGTYATPTASKCRFKEVDATNHKGLYEFQFANARFAIASARSLAISVTGAASLLDADYEIQLVSFDPHDSVRMGLTAMPNAAADGAGGLPISDAGGLDLDTKLANAHEITAARMGALTDWIDGGRLDLLLDAIPTTAMRGTDNAALASVLGELNDAASDGDPTAADTLMKYIKQLINILVGTAGIVAFPAEAGPANAISLAEVIRAIHADVTGLNGSVMVGTDGANTTVPDAAGIAATPAEVATALTNINLDHLCKTATAGADMTAEVIDNTILSRILSNGDTSVFVPSTDGLQLIRDRGDSAWTTGAGGSDRLLMVDTTIATLASQTSFTLTAGSADDDAYNNCTIVIEDVSTATQKAVGIISDYTGATKTIILKYDPAIFAIAATDKVYILAENALKSTLANRQLNVAADGDIAGNIDGSVASVVGHTVQTGDGYAILNNGTHGNAALETLVDEIETILKHATYGNSALQVLIAALQTDLDNGTDGLGALKILIDAVPTVGEIQAEMEENGASILDTLRDDLADGGRLDLLIDRILTATEITQSSVNDVGATTTKFITNLTETDDDFWNRGAILFTSGNNSGQMRRIKDYNGSTKEITVQTILNAAPANADTFVIVAERAFLTVDIPDIADAVLDELTAGHVGAGSLAKAVSDILVDTNDLQTSQGNWATATGFSTHDAAAVKTAIEAAGSHLALIKAQTDLVTAARMGALTDWIDGGRLDLIIDIIAADTTTDIPALIAALNDLSAANINTEVVDVLKTDTKGEPAQGAPGATLSIEDKIAYIYKFLRNKIWTTSTGINIYNDAGDAVDHKSTISDDGTTFKRGEFISGP